ncbi:MAG: hypothetical protein MUE96_00470 [Bacteroidia bacterium]|jgi:hypothetical protein|nr:hypothetical protein [Bacteroidia bacterium]
MKHTYFFKTLLIAQTLLVLIYTIFAFTNEGANLFAIFIANIKELNWNGQFNLDFASYLSLSGLWIMWRNNFSISAIILAILAAIVGIIVFAPYLLYLLIKVDGNIPKLLVGDR